MFKIRQALAILLLPGAVIAAPDDYAYRAQLTAAEDGLQRLVLPARIIGDLTSPGLGDLAVFNADGKALPQLVIATPDRVSENRIELPFHEFDTFLRQRSKTVTRREQNRQDDQLSELATTEVVAVESVRKDYLVELRPDDSPRDFDRLELDWRHEPTSQVLQLRAEAGDEFDRLRTIVARKSLTNRESDDIDWRSLPGVAARHRYLRLSPVNDIESFELRGVTGHFREYSKPPQLVIEVMPGLVEADGIGYYRFELPSAVTPAAMRIVPVASSTVLDGDLYVKTRDSEYRSLVARRFRQHNLVGDDIKAAAPLQMPPRRYDEVWFTLTERQDRAPRVELLYTQRELVFLADGNGPYSVAWGNYAVTSPPPGLAGLVEVDLQQGDSKITAISMLAVEQAGGKARLEPAPQLPWKQWLLWALLIAAALIAGRMAYGLYRDMNPAS